MVNTCDTRHPERNDIRVSDGFRIVEECVSELHFHIASGITIIRNAVGCQTIITCRHRKHRLVWVSSFISEIEVVAERLVDDNIHNGIASVIGSAHG